MDVDPPLTNLTQQTLFYLNDTSYNTIELFPSVWTAAEALTSPELAVRQAGFERLEGLNAARFSPLVAYLLATRIKEPDIKLRVRVVRHLASVFSPDEKGQMAPDAVRQHLKAFLSQMRNRSLFSLLQVADFDPTTEPCVAALLKACPFAGNNLACILADRRLRMSIRKQAVIFIGKVGYLDAIPALERIASRLESRLNGQQAMPFAPTDGNDEAELLAPVMTAITQLRAP
jgi:hypothetical protein